MDYLPPLTLHTIVGANVIRIQNDEKSSEMTKVHFFDWKTNQTSRKKGRKNLMFSDIHYPKFEQTFSKQIIFVV